MKATMRLTKNVQQCEKQFRHCAFNVLAYNRDDHAKNFSFLIDEMDLWRVSPAYDLRFSHPCTIIPKKKDYRTA
jgi:serine/threonine-protein kinase HipA